MEEKQLLKAAREGDKEALIKLMMLQKEAYYKLAYVYMKNKEDALDAMQDMIVSVYENIYKLRDEKAFYSWSKTILVNCCKGILKARNRIEPLEDMKDEGCEKGILQQEDRLVLEQYLLRLSEKHQEVIRLRYFLDMDYEAIAGLLKIPLGTVKSRIFTGLNQLKKGLGGEGYARD